MLLLACEDQHEHTAPAIHARDSVAVMVSYGVNTLISDSGVAKYRIVTEQWDVNTNLNPSRWLFNKGILTSVRWYLTVVLNFMCKPIFNATRPTIMTN